MTEERLRKASPPRWIRGTVACAVLLVTACGGPEEEAPLEDTGAEVDGGAVGPDASVTEDIGLSQVQLEYPLDGVYEEGDEARLFFAITNTGTGPAQLVDIRGPDFSGVQVETAEGAGLPLEVDPNDNLYVGAEGAPDVMLVDLERSLRSSQSIPVTFSFADAEEVTLDVVVSAEGDTPIPPFDFPDEGPEQDPTDEGL